MCSFVKNEALAQVFSGEFWKIRKNTFFAEHHETTAFDYSSITTVNYFRKKAASQMLAGLKIDFRLRV